MFRGTTLRPPLMFIALLAGCDDSGDPIGTYTGDPGLAVSSLGSLDGLANERFTVLTRNVYLGADVGPVFEVDFTDPIAVIQASASVWAEVQSTRFAERAVALVEEIEEHRPQLIGLQEVARFITLDAGFNPTGSLDFLAILEAEMADRGLGYQMIATQENTHVTLPVAFDFEAFVVTEYVDFTDRDVVFARSDVSITYTEQANYAADFTVTEGVTLKRGWIRVDTEHRGETYHFVNTHLEGQSRAEVQAAQVAELLNEVMAGLTGVTVLVGDLNSDAAAGPGSPSWTPSYDELISRGFVDTWEQSNPSSHESGYTCCNASDLTNLRSSFDQRIDFVLIRADHEALAERLMGSVHAEVLGEETEDLTTGGLWPSDHGGVLAGVRLAPGLLAQD